VQRRLRLWPRAADGEGDGKRAGERKAWKKEAMANKRDLKAWEKEAGGQSHMSKVDASLPAILHSRRSYSESRAALAWPIADEVNVHLPFFELSIGGNLNFSVPPSARTCQPPQAGAAIHCESFTEDTAGRNERECQWKAAFKKLGRATARVRPAP